MGEKVKRTKPLKNFGGKECSVEFALAFIGGGSFVADCDACGRTHFYDSEDEGWNESEYEDLVSKSEAEPDRYVAHSDDDVRYGTIFGKQVVYNCPCGYAAWLEDRIWRNRKWICRYLVERAKLEAKNANENARVISEAAVLVKES